VAPELANRAADFFNDLFEYLFSGLYESLPSRLDQRRVERQVSELADAASQSLARFLGTKEFDAADVDAILAAFSAVRKHLNRDRLANPNESPDVVADELLKKAKVPKRLLDCGEEPAFRLAVASERKRGE